MDNMITTCTIAPARIEDTLPCGFKLRQKADGTYVLVAAFRWSCGQEGGVEWRELETEFEK